MALAVTHVILTIIILDLFRHYVFGREKFPRYLLVIGGIAGLFPDIDIPIGWIVSLISGTTVNLHRVFTHSIFFVALFLVLGILFHYQNKQKWAKIMYVIAAGWSMHLFLDCIYGGKPIRSFFWPSLIIPSFCPTWNVYTYATYIDAILLVLWLVHEEIHNKIRDYF